MTINIDINKIIAELVEKESKTRAEWQALRTKLSEKTWWKILRKEGDKYVSCHGGSLEWPIPQSPNEFSEVEVGGAINTCRSGLHITSDPSHWLGDGKGTTLHKVEVGWFDENLKIGRYEDDGEKIAVSRLHVYGEADACTCQEAGIAYRSDFSTILQGRNQHVVMNGHARAFGNHEGMGQVTVEGNGFLESANHTHVNVESGRAIVNDDCIVELAGGDLVVKGSSVVKECKAATTLALYGASIAHIGTTIQQRIYAADGATVVIHDNPNDLECLILSKNARAITPTGRAIKPVNADKFKVVACKDGMRKIVAR